MKTKNNKSNTNQEIQTKRITKTKESIKELETKNKKEQINNKAIQKSKIRI